MAELRRYTLEPEGSDVGFAYDILGQTLQGSIPVAQADIAIDFSDVKRTRAEVVLNATQARGGVALATQALRGSAVLAVQRYPTIRFSATRTRSEAGGAVMEGDLTVRDVTRQVRLNARFLRPPESDPNDMTRLTILLTGRISRGAFGAAGYADLVEDQIDLRIRAALRVLN